MSKPQGGLTKWFKEDWRDIKTGKKCGRSGEERVSSHTPPADQPRSQQDDRRREESSRRSQDRPSCDLR